MTMTSPRLSSKISVYKRLLDAMKDSEKVNRSKVKMKCILLFLFAIGAAVAQGPTLDVLSAFHSRSDFRTECAKDTNVEIMKLVQAAPSTWSQFNSPNYKKYFLCVSKKMGWQDENGKLQKDVIRRALAGVAHGNPDAQKVVDQIIDSCAIEKSTPEDTAYNFVTCMTAYAP